MLRDRIFKRGVSSSLSYGKKWTGFKVAYRSTKDICGFAICGFAICGLTQKLRICDLRIGTTEKCADFRNEPKNLRICDLQDICKKVPYRTYTKQPRLKIRQFVFGKIACSDSRIRVCAVSYLCTGITHISAVSQTAATESD
jgi:hypothetical protein